MIKGMYKVIEPAQLIGTVKNMILGSNVADLLVRHILADLAETERLFGLDHRRRKVLDLRLRKSEKVKSDALRRLFAYAGKRRELLDQFCDAFRIKGHIFTSG